MKLDFPKLKEAFKRFLEKVANRVKAFLERFEDKEATSTPPDVVAPPVGPVDPTPVDVSPPPKPVEPVYVPPVVVGDVPYEVSGGPFSYSGAALSMAGPEESLFQSQVDMTDPNLKDGDVTFSATVGRFNSPKLRSFDVYVNGTLVGTHYPNTTFIIPFVVGTLSVISFKFHQAGSLSVKSTFNYKK